jgi:hypothetical protein
LDGVPGLLLVSFVCPCVVWCGVADLKRVKGLSLLVRPSSEEWSVKRKKGRKKEKKSRTKSSNR